MRNSRYNIVYDKRIHLEPGETFCPNCDGKGKVPLKYKPEEGGRRLGLTCMKCNGSGKLDWIEKAMGKRKRKWFDIEDEIISNLAEEVAREFDKEILQQITKEMKEDNL